MLPQAHPKGFSRQDEDLRIGVGEDQARRGSWLRFPTRPRLSHGPTAESRPHIQHGACREPKSWENSGSFREMLKPTVFSPCSHPGFGSLPICVAPFPASVSLSQGRSRGSGCSHGSCQAPAAPRGWGTRPQCGFRRSREELGPGQPLLSFIFIPRPRAAGTSPAAAPALPAEDATLARARRAPSSSSSSSTSRRAGMFPMRRECRRLSLVPAAGHGAEGSGKIFPALPAGICPSHPPAPHFPSARRGQLLPARLQASIQVCRPFPWHRIPGIWEVNSSPVSPCARVGAITPGRGGKWRLLFPGPARWDFSFGFGF